MKKEDVMKKKEVYQTAIAEIVYLDTIDVITSSIEPDLGENDGEWTAFIGIRGGSAGIFA